jgi:hypothetical protein
VTTVAELVAVLRADARQFTATMEGAQAEVAALGAESKAASGMVSKAMLGIGAASVAGIALAVKAFQSWASEVRNVTRVTGLSAEAASKLAFAGEEVGVSTTTMATSFGILAKNIQTNSKFLTTYGIDVTKANGEQRSLNSILGQAADEYIALGGGLKGAAMAQQLFGRGGRALIPLLTRGSEGIKALGDQAERLGLVMSQDDLDAARDLSIAERELGATFKGVGVSIGREFLPIVTEVVQKFQGVVEWIGQLNPDLVANALRFGALLGAIAAVNKVGVILIGWGKTAVGMLGTLTGVTTTTAASMTTLEAAEVDAAVAGKLFIANAQGMVISEREVAANAAITTDALVAEGDATVAAGGKMKAFAAGAWAARGGIIAFAVGAIAAKNQIDNIYKGADDLANQFQITEEQAAGLQSRMNGPLLGGDWKDIGHNLADMNPFAHGVEEASTAFQAFAADALSAGKSQVEVNAAFDAALPLLNGNRASISSFSDELYKSIGLQKDQTGALEDTTTAMDDLIASSSQLKQITNAQGAVAAGTAQLASVSGQDLSKLSAAYDDLITNAKATTQDYLDVLGQLQGAEDAFTQSTVDAFGGASGALSKFSGQQHVDAGKMEGALQSYMDKLQTWRHAFNTIMQGSGKDAQQFAADMRSQGLDSIGMLQAVAGMTDKQRQHFFDMYNTANKGTQDLADVITHKLVPKFDLMISRLTAIAVKMGAIPDPSVNFSQVLAGLNQVQQEAMITAEKLALLGAGGGSSGHSGSHRPQGAPPLGDNKGGFFGGLVTDSGIRRFARGGFAEDTIPAWLSAGEFVMRRAAVKRIGVSQLRAWNEGVSAPAPIIGAAVGGPAAPASIKVQIRPDRRRFVRDLDEDYLTRGW